jgi:hypothetical protein
LVAIVIVKVLKVAAEVTSNFISSKEALVKVDPIDL